MSGKTKGSTRKTNTKKVATKKAPAKAKSTTASKTRAKTAAKSKVAKTATAKRATKTHSAAKPVSTSRTTKTKPATATASKKQSQSKSPTTRAGAGSFMIRSESDLSAVIDSLSSQMNSAMTTLTNLAVAQQGKAESVMRTAPLDRASSMFHRLVGEVIDEHWADMLPPIVALRIELDDRFNDESNAESEEAEFYERARDMLDQVLESARVIQYDARIGETFDSVIHQAVGETHRGDLDNGAIGELIQAGFRTERGKVVSPAKVKVNRR